MPGFADTKKRAFKDCFIDRAVAANPRSPPGSPEEAETEALTAIGQDPGQVKAHQTRWTLRTEVVPWLAKSLCRVSIKSSHAWASAISVLDLCYRLCQENNTASFRRNQNPQNTAVLYQDFSTETPL